MLHSKTTPAAARKDRRLSRLLGDIEAASEDTKLLAFILVLEAVRSGPGARETALVGEAMCNLSARGTTFSQHVRACLPAPAQPSQATQDLAELRRMSRAIADLMHQATDLAGADPDGAAVDKTTLKPAVHLLEEIDARMRAIDDVLGTTPNAGATTPIPT